MSATTVLPSAAQEAAAPTARVLRTAGIAGLMYALIYAITFTANSLASTMLASFAKEYPTPAELQDQLPFSATFAIAFSAIGLFGLVAMTGVGAYLGRRGSVLSPAMAALAAVVAVGTIGAGVAAVAQRSMANDYIAGSGAELGAQSAVVQGLFVVPQTFAAPFGVAFALWLILAAIAGRGGAVPRWLRAINVIFGAIGLGALYLGFPFGLLLSIPYFALLGGWALRASRSA